MADGLPAQIELDGVRRGAVDFLRNCEHFVLLVLARPGGKEVQQPTPLYAIAGDALAAVREDQHARVYSVVGELFVAQCAPRAYSSAPCAQVVAG